MPSQQQQFALSRRASSAAAAAAAATTTNPSSSSSSGPATRSPPQPASSSSATPGTSTIALSSHICICPNTTRVPRPRNAFILYRQHHHAKVVAANPGKTNPEISKIIGERWRSLGQAEKDFWVQLGDEEKKSHSERFPDYRYQPRRSSKRAASADSIPGICPVCKGITSSAAAANSAVSTPAARDKSPSASVPASSQALAHQVSTAPPNGSSYSQPSTPATAPSPAPAPLPSLPNTPNFHSLDSRMGLPSLPPLSQSSSQSSVLPLPSSLSHPYSRNYHKNSAPAAPIEAEAPGNKYDLSYRHQSAPEISHASTGSYYSSAHVSPEATSSNAPPQFTNGTSGSGGQGYYPQNGSLSSSSSSSASDTYSASSFSSSSSFSSVSSGSLSASASSISLYSMQNYHQGPPPPPGNHSHHGFPGPPGPLPRLEKLGSDPYSYHYNRSESSSTRTSASSPADSPLRPFTFKRDSKPLELIDGNTTGNNNSSPPVTSSSATATLVAAAAAVTTTTGPPLSSHPHSHAPAVTTKLRSVFSSPRQRTFPISPGGTPTNNPSNATNNNSSNPPGVLLTSSIMEEEAAFKRRRTSSYHDPLLPGTAMPSRTERYKSAFSLANSHRGDHSCGTGPAHYNAFNSTHGFYETSLVSINEQSDSRGSSIVSSSSFSGASLRSVSCASAASTAFHTLLSELSIYDKFEMIAGICKIPRKVSGDHQPTLIAVEGMDSELNQRVATELTKKLNARSVRLDGDAKPLYLTDVEAVRIWRVACLHQQMSALVKGRHKTRSKRGGDKSLDAETSEDQNNDDKPNDSNNDSNDHDDRDEILVFSDYLLSAANDLASESSDDEEEEMELQDHTDDARQQQENDKTGDPAEPLIDIEGSPASRGATSAPDLGRTPTPTITRRPISVSDLTNPEPESRDAREAAQEDRQSTVSPVSRSTVSPPPVDPIQRRDGSLVRREGSRVLSHEQQLRKSSLQKSARRRERWTSGVHMLRGLPSTDIVIYVEPLDSASTPTASTTNKTTASEEGRVEVRMTGLRNGTRMAVVQCSTGEEARVVSEVCAALGLSK